MNPAELSQALNTISIDVTLSDQYPGEPFSFKVKKNFHTACWSYVRHYQQPHQMYFGEQCLDNGREDLTAAEEFEYLKSIARHELCHARETERDLQKVSTLLKAVGIAFSTWNLFEDARIEHRDRVREGKKFNWAKFETIDRTRTDAGHQFFLLIQLENEGRSDRNPTVLGFYDRAIAAETTLDLIPILQEWVRLFGDLPNMQRFGGELEAGSALQANEDYRTKFENESFVPGGNPKGKESDEDAPGIASNFMNDEDQGYDDAKAIKLADRLSILYGTRKTAFYKNDPSKRISARNLTLGRPAYRHHTEVRTASKNIVLIVDCSGSMRGKPIREAAIMAGVFSELARRGKITGAMILSAMVGDRAISEAYDFPVDASILSRLWGFGCGEGLNSAVLAHLDKINGADTVFAITDASLNPEIAQRKKVRALGINLCGLYAGEPEMAEEMAENFKTFIIRDDVDNLVDAVIQARIL